MSFYDKYKIAISDITNEKESAEIVEGQDSTFSTVFDSNDNYHFSSMRIDYGNIFPCWRHIKEPDIPP